jgi:hypothetical protein
MKEMVVEEQGRRVVVPAGEQFTLETIHDHFWMPAGTEGKPRGWEIDRAGKRASETTIKIWFGPEFKPDLDWLNSFNAKAKLATSANLAEKTKYTIPFNFTQIRELFEDRFGKKTDPYTYISIYGEAPSRDDWGLVMINPPPMDGQKEKKMNYIVWGDDGIWTFYLNYI